MKKINTVIFLCLAFNFSQAQTNIWFDTDLMIGQPERAPREVDDGITLIMALKQPQIKIVGISTVTYADYGVETAKKIMQWHYTGPAIPVYAGSKFADNLGEETAGSIALYEALKKQKLTILALGPVTNVATVLKNHPEIAGQIDSIVMCAARTPDFHFKPGLETLTVYDYNYEKDTASINVLLRSNINLVFAGFESSRQLLIGKTDIDRLHTNMEGDKWLYNVLRPWQQRALSVFGVEGFIPYDCTVLGVVTHPKYFKTWRNIPVDVVIKDNDSKIVQKGVAVKPYLEVNFNSSSTRTVQFVYATLPGFEEEILETLNQKK